MSTDASPEWEGPQGGTHHPSDPDQPSGAAAQPASPWAAGPLPPQWQQQAPWPQVPNPAQPGQAPPQPWSQGPTSAPPTSPPPPPLPQAWSPQPATPQPATQQQAWATRSASSMGLDPDPLGEGSSWSQQRIVPSPPAPRSRLLLGLLIGALVGLVAAGPSGYFIGASGKDNPAPGPSGRPGPSGTTSLPAYEASQAALNKAKLDSDMMPLAQLWLPSMGGCVNDRDEGGPKLDIGEKAHVFCRYGGLSIHFVTYNSVTDRNNARTYRQRLALESPDLAPGMAEAGVRQGGVSKVSGHYVEYAFKSGDSTLAGLWWDRGEEPSAMFIETPWEQGLGAQWDPLRDVWQRHS